MFWGCFPTQKEMMACIILRSVSPACTDKVNATMNYTSCARTCKFQMLSAMLAAAFRHQN
eukprot:6491117-Amphidinium_carterae.1